MRKRRVKETEEEKLQQSQGTTRGLTFETFELLNGPSFNS